MFAALDAGARSIRMLFCRVHAVRLWIVALPKSLGRIGSVRSLPGSAIGQLRTGGAAASYPGDGVWA